MHAQSKDIFAHFKESRAYETASEFKKEGKIRHFGISFHDTADMPEEIPSEYPEIKAVQIQLNYVDYEDPAVQSRKCLEVCRKFGKPVIVMEPDKGGNLVSPPLRRISTLRSLVPRRRAVSNRKKRGKTRNEFFTPP